MNPFRTLRLSDLRGVVRLATRATTGVADLAESVHQTVWSTLGVAPVAPGRTGGVTGLVYRGVRGVANGVGGMSEGLLDAIENALSATAKTPSGAPTSLPESPIREVSAASESRTREALLAVLSGVLGDRLAAEDNPLATRMALRCRGEVLGLDATRTIPGPVTGKVLLLVHGLCMNDLQWQPQWPGGFAGHGARLEQALGMTPVYVRYNSGLPVFRNGEELSARIEQLLSHWPVDVDQLCIVGHSMGGLVARSALHAGQSTGAQWPSRLRKMVFLGTPHHGAPLERAGSWVDHMLGSTPFTAPFARLGELRSAGIVDLRFGRVLESAGASGPDRGEAPTGSGRASQRSDAGPPLPGGVQCYTVAAALAASRGALSDRLTGDGLVPVRSALGDHDDPDRQLRFAATHKHVAWRTGHVELLSRPEIGERLVHWLAS